MKMNDKILAMILAEHVQAYHNTDPSMVFNNRTCEVYETSIGLTINLFDEPAKAFTGILDNGPTIKYVVNGRLHRLDGPAMIWRDSPRRDFFKNGVEISAKEFKAEYLMTHLREYQE